MAAAAAAAVGLPDVFTVNGTNQADRIDITARDGQISVSGPQAEIRLTGSDTFDHLQINTLDGDDNVTVDPNVPSLIGLGVDLGSGQV